MKLSFSAAGLLLALILISAPAQSQQPPTAIEKIPDLLPKISVGLTVEQMPRKYGGVFVREVDRGSPAEKAGLREGDVVTRVCFKRIDDFDEFVCHLAGHKPGDKATLHVVRGDRIKHLKLTFGEPGIREVAGSPDQNQQVKQAQQPNQKEKVCKAPPFLGVITTTTQQLEQDIIDRLGLLKDDEGAIVIEIVPGSPAAKAGLRYGDVICCVNQTNVDDAHEFQEQIYKMEPGQEVSLKICRGEHERTVNATLVESPMDVRLGTGRETYSENGSAPNLQRLEHQLEQLRKQLQRLEQKLEGLQK